MTEMTNAARRGDLGKIMKLVYEGHNINQKDGDGWTPLTAAAYNGHTDCVQWLIQRGAELEGRTALGMTALHYAAREGHHSTVELLLQHKADPNATDAEELHFLAKIARALLLTNEQRKKGVTALHEAAENGHHSIVELLLQHKANPNANDVEGYTPLIRGAQGGHLEVVRLLLNHGAQVEQKVGWGMTALHWAAENGHHSTVELLLQHKADPNATDAKELHFLAKIGLLPTDEQPKKGVTALHYAAVSGHHSIVELLLQHKADPNATDEDGYTVPAILKRTTTSHDIDSALKNGYENLIMILLEYYTGSSSTAKLVDKKGRTLLHWAAYAQNPTCTEKLLNSGANLNAEDNNKDTPLHLALRNYKMERSWFGRSGPQCAKILLDRGAEVEGHGIGGQTVLHEAAGKGASDVLEFLLKYNVNINMTNNAGNTPLKLALDNDKQECVTMMMQRGAKLHGSDKSSTAEPGTMVRLLYSLTNSKLVNLISRSWS